MNILSQHYATFKTLIRLPVARLRFEAAIEPANVPTTYRYYTKRHPKYKLIQNKSWGAALIDLGQYDSCERYFECIQARNRAKRARARGYVVAEIDRNRHVDAIYDINTSIGQRQGRPMDAAYCKKTLAFETLSNFHYYGVLNADGKLVAYANIGRYGNFCAFEQLMGYRNNDGIMHLMVSHIVARLIDEGAVDYVMYDTFFGALPGLQLFKTELGFQPYRVHYKLLR